MPWPERRTTSVNALPPGGGTARRRRTEVAGGAAPGGVVSGRGSSRREREKAAPTGAILVSCEDCSPPWWGGLWGLEGLPEKLSLNRPVGVPKAAAGKLPGEGPCPLLTEGSDIVQQNATPTLSPTQEAALAALITGKNLSAAAEAAGVDRS